MTLDIQNEIQKLEKINRDQKIIIQLLCDAYYSEDKNNQILNLIANSSPNFLNSILDCSKSNNSISINDDLNRIQELEKLIIEQDSAHAKLEQQLIEYNAKAQEYEEELAQNEREKARILASFQQSSNTISNASNMSEHFKELEKRAQELNEECNKTRAKNENAQMLAGEIQHQLTKSQGYVKKLEKEVENVKSQLSNSQNDQELLNEIQKQEEKIQSLTAELEAANKKIEQMKRENQSLRDKLMNIDDSE